MLWSTRVPSKIRIFLWRLARQSLPSKDVLHHRNMADNSMCSLCGCPDSWKHSLLQCNMSRCVWALEREEVTEYLADIREEDAKGWILTAERILNQEDFTRVAVTLWAVWYARRKAIHENIYQSPLSTHLFISWFVDELKQEKIHQPSGSSTGSSTGRVHPRWIPPPPGLMKINVDAAIAKNSNRASASAVARDNAGNFLVLEGVTDPETMESIACKEALALAADLDLRRFRVASDCSNVIKSIKENGMGAYAQIVRKIRAWSSDFLATDFVHEHRSSNGDAHNLARSLISADSGRHVWYINPPEGVCISYNSLS